MSLLAICFIIFGSSLIGAFIIISLWGFFATSAPVAWWTWLSKTLPNDAEAGGGLMVAIIQLAIAIGSALGGLFFDLYGYEITFIFSALILAVSALVSSATAFYTLKK